ncbi:hypothetical protein HK102_008306, partial [Quaeritorhiza haematococci]
SARRRKRDPNASDWQVDTFDGTTSDDFPTRTVWVGDSMLPLQIQRSRGVLRNALKRGDLPVAWSNYEFLMKELRSGAVTADLDKAAGSGVEGVSSLGAMLMFDETIRRQQTILRHRLIETKDLFALLRLLYNALPSGTLFPSTTDTDQLEQIFEQILNRIAETEDPILPPLADTDVEEAFYALIDVKTRLGRVDEALQLFDQLKELLMATGWDREDGSMGRMLKDAETGGPVQRPPSLMTYRHVIKTFANVPLPSRAQQVFDDMCEKGVEPDVETYRILIDAYAEARDPKGATLIYEDLLRRSKKDKERRETDPQESDQTIPLLEPDRNIYNGLIRAHARCLDADSALKVLQDMKERKIQPTNRAYNSILNVYAKTGRKDDAAKLFATMVEDSRVRTEPSGRTLRPVNPSCTPDVATFGALINLHAQIGDVEGANKFLDLMIQRSGSAEGKLAPNGIIFNTVMTAHRKAGDVEGFRTCMNRMREWGIEPTANHYANLIGLFAEKKDVKGAHHVYFTEMVCNKPPLDPPHMHEPVTGLEGVKVMPDLKTFKNLVHVHGRLGDLNWMDWFYLDQMKLRFGLLPDAEILITKLRYTHSFTRKQLWLQHGEKERLHRVKDLDRWRQIMWRDFSDLLELYPLPDSGQNMLGLYLEGSMVGTVSEAAQVAFETDLMFQLLTNPQSESENKNRKFERDHQYQKAIEAAKEAYDHAFSAKTWGEPDERTLVVLLEFFNRFSQLHEQLTFAPVVPRARQQREQAKPQKDEAKTQPKPHPQPQPKPQQPHKKQQQKQQFTTTDISKKYEFVKVDSEIAQMEIDILLKVYGDLAKSRKELSKEVQERFAERVEKLTKIAEGGGSKA